MDVIKGALIYKIYFTLKQDQPFINISVKKIKLIKKLSLEWSWIVIIEFGSNMVN